MHKNVYNKIMSKSMVYTTSYVYLSFVLSYFLSDYLLYGILKNEFHDERSGKFSNEQ